jgi:hypothetical protein
VQHSCVIPPTWRFTNQQKIILVKERDPKLAKEWELGYDDGLGSLLGIQNNASYYSEI